MMQPIYINNLREEEKLARNLYSRVVPNANPRFFVPSFSRVANTGDMYCFGNHRRLAMLEPASFFFEQGKKAHVFCFAGHKPYLLNGIVEHIFHVADDFVFFH